MIVVGFGFGGLFAAGVVLKLVLKEKSVQVGLNPLVVCSAALIFLRVFVAFLNGFPCSWSSDYSLDFFLWTFCRIHHFLIFGDFNATVLFL